MAHDTPGRQGFQLTRQRGRSPGRRICRPGRLRPEDLKRAVAGPVGRLEVEAVGGDDPQSRAVRSPARRDDVAGTGRECANDRGQAGHRYRPARQADQRTGADVRDVDGGTGHRPLAIDGVERKRETLAGRIEIRRVVGIDHGAWRQGDQRAGTAPQIGDVQRAAGRAGRSLPGHVVRVGAGDDRVPRDAGGLGGAVRCVDERQPLVGTADEQAAHGGGDQCPAPQVAGSAQPVAILIDEPRRASGRPVAPGRRGLLDPDIAPVGGQSQVVRPGDDARGAGTRRADRDEDDVSDVGQAR